jgi:hypothetical protein
MVECLPNKHEALNSNPSTSKKKRKKERKRTLVFLGMVDGTYNPSPGETDHEFKASLGS